MSNRDLAQNERNALCDLALALGSDSPTLCEGWAVQDLLAHLYVRERKPLAMPGIIFSSLAGMTERAMKKTLQQHSFAELVEKIRTGPPLHMKAVDGQTNLIEYFIHHEDIRRANGQTAPREGIEKLEEGMWVLLGRMGRLLLRGLDDIDLTLALPSGETKHIKKGSREVTLTGRAGELVLFTYGRGENAEVELAGTDEAVTALQETKLGI